MGSGELELELEMRSMTFCLPLDIFVVFEVRWC